LPKKKNKKRGYHRYMDDEEIQHDYADDFTMAEFAEFEALMEEFPELDELDGLLDFNDEDFYTKHGD
jgi:hypothetical protein